MLGCRLFLCMVHHCQAAVLHCIDFRFQEAIDQFLAKQGLNGNTDRIGIAGGVKNMGEMFNELSISERLHQVQEMYLINHQDCGAYGPETAKDADVELQTHKSDLLTAKTIIHEKFPNVNVKAYFLTLEMEFVEIS